MPPGAKTANGAGSWGGAALLHLGCVGRRAQGHCLRGQLWGATPRGTPIASHPAGLPRRERCRERPSSARRGRGFPHLRSLGGYPGRLRKEQRRFPPRHGGYAPKCAGGLLAQPVRILQLKSCCCCSRESGAAPPAGGCRCSPRAPRSRPRLQDPLLGPGCEDSPAAACRWDLPALLSSCTF